jgi:hypothetical protein
MIAQHGYTILDNNNRVIPDPAHEGEDEGIIHVIDKYHSGIYLYGEAAINPSLAEKIKPSTVEVSDDPTLKTHSLGCMVALIAHEYYLDESASIDYEYFECLGMEAMYVVLRYKSKWRCGSIISCSPQGIIAFDDEIPGFGVWGSYDGFDTPIPGVKINQDTTIDRLHEILTHHHEPDIIFTKAIKGPTRRIEYSDVFITTTDE